MRLLRFFAFAALAVLAFTAARPALAYTYCVGSVQDLDNALVFATLPTGQTTVIQLQEGTYHLGGSFLVGGHDFNAMQLLGGYNADCSARSVVPANTIFDGDAASIHPIGMHGDLRIEGIRFQDFNAELAIVYDGADSITTRVFSNEFFNAGGLFVGYAECSNGFLVVENNLVAGAQIGMRLTSYHHDGNASDAVFMQVVNNTVASSADRGIEVLSALPPEFDNNIVWGSGNRDFWVQDGHIADNHPGSAQYIDNTYVTRFGAESSGSSGTLNTDPLFVSGYNFRLQNSSTSINSGDNSVPGGLPAVDLDGNPRIVGSAPDRGAYESSVDNTVPFTITVTNANDSGAGSLRQAINDANAGPGFNFIYFNIPGSCPQTISLASDLPTITDGALVNGFTQPGSSANTLPNGFGDNAVRCIVLNGGGVRGDGLTYLGPAGSQLWIQGLVFEGFTSNAVDLFTGNNHLVWGSQFGGFFNGQTLTPNTVDVGIFGGVTGAQIGGANAAQQNIIAGATKYGVSIPYGFFGNASGNTIQGNLIGTRAEAGTAAANATGIDIETDHNAVADNVISGNAVDGIFLSGSTATANTISGNRIGVKGGLVFCFTPPCLPTIYALPNGRHGIRFEAGAHDNLVQRNTVEFNTVMGVSVSGSGHGNELGANSIYYNASYGIDLDGSGLNDNDGNPSAQNLPNRGLNFPTITRAYGGTNIGWVDGSLASTNDFYQIQVFSSPQCDSTGNGEGEVFHRSGAAFISNAPAGGNGSTNFHIAFNAQSVNLQGRSIALTAIDSAGNTSEFSYCHPYLCDVIFRHGFDSANGDSCSAP